MLNHSVTVMKLQYNDTQRPHLCSQRALVCVPQTNALKLYSLIRVQSESTGHLGQTGIVLLL